MSRPTVLVLAGGKSDRVWPLRDKLLIRFGGQSLLERHVRNLVTLGCRQIIVVANSENAGAVESALTEIDAEIQVVIQPEPRGMADAVLWARDALSAVGDGSIYVTQAHDVVGPVLHAAILDALESGEAAGYVAAQRVETYFPGGYLKLEEQRVVELVEKPGAGNEPSNLVSIVAHAFGSWRSLLDAISQESATPGSDDAYERALSRLMAASEFRAVVFEGRWQALKYPWHVLSVMDMLLERWTNGVESPGTDYEQTEEGVFIGRDVQIYPGSHVVAPSLIGHGSVVGHNALVRGSVVGEKSVIGFGSEVARSYLADGVELHHNYVGDSVLDRETSLGFGATTANCRIDGRTVPSRIGADRVDSGRMKLGLVMGAGATIGVNTSTMPGSKIGAGAIIGPNLRVTRDVPDGQRLLDERGYGRF